MKETNHKKPTHSKFIEVLAKINKEHPTERDLKQIQACFLEKDALLPADDAMALEPVKQPALPEKLDKKEFLALQKLSRNLISNQIQEDLHNQRRPEGAS